jgi:hypothetical protein
MQNKMLEINEVQRRQKLPELAMGIGINTGEVIVGNIGSEKRTKYGAVGSAINTTYRIESYTTGGQILISARTYEKVQSKVRVQKTMEVQFKGVDHLVTLYDVVGMKGNFELALAQKTNGIFIGLDPPMPITCFTLDGKEVAGAANSGHITHLADSVAEVLLEGAVKVYANLKVLLAFQDSPGVSEMYAKVISIEQADSHSPHMRARLEFTWMPKDAKAFLEKRLSSAPHREP